MDQCKNCPQEGKRWKCVGEFEANYKKGEVREDIIHVLKLLYEQERELIIRKVSERTITAKFFNLFVQEYRDKYAQLNIDTEYNRNGVEAKYYIPGIGMDARSASPDFIVHKRNCNKHNVLMIEFKTYWGKDTSEDLIKLKAFTNPHEGLIYKDKILSYAYDFGVSVVLNKDNVVLQWVMDGARRETEILAIDFHKEQ